MHVWQGEWYCVRACAARMGSTPIGLAANREYMLKLVVSEMPIKRSSMKSIKRRPARSGHRRQHPDCQEN